MKRISTFLVIVFICLLSQTLLSQVNWQQCQGIYGGEVRCFAVASNGNTYMGSNGSGIYKTTDEGNNWTKVNTGILNLNVRAMAFNTSDHLYAGIQSETGYGILRTTNNGLNWNYTEFTDNDIRTIALNSNGHIFVGMDSTGIYRSTDNGVSYSQINNGLTFRKIRSIAINSSGVLFAAAYTGGVFKSTDNGDNWSQVITGLTNLYVNAVAINPVNGYIFVGTGNAVFSGAVYRSTNNGGIWTIMTLTGAWILNIAVNPTGIIYTGSISRGGDPKTYAHVSRSTDGGGTWNAVGAGPSGAFYAGLNAFVLKNTNVYIGTNFGIHRSINNGYFDLSINGFTGQVVNSLFKTNPNGNILAGTNCDYGIYRSINGGLNWVSENSFGRVKGFAVNSFGYIHTSVYDWYYEYSYIWKSTNEGGSWAGSGFINSPKSVQAITINPLDYIFVATAGDGIFRSINNGGNWTAINLSNNNVWSLFSIDSTTSIFAGTGGGKIFRSTDYGFGWDQVYISPISTNNVRSLVKSSTNVLYAGLDTGGIITSSDNGTTWTQSSFTVPRVNVITFNTFGYIFAGTGKNGVYKSTDNGNSWEQINAGLINTQINALGFDNNNYLYCGTNGNSVYKTTLPVIGINNISSEIPSSYSLHQNYPNPFNPTTKIRFDVPSSENVIIKVYDMLGREAATLINQNLQAGTYETEWDASGYSSGIYYYKIVSGDYIETKKMILIK